jgi:hypothetical protein
MTEQRKEPVYWIKSLGDLTKALPGEPAIQPPPDVCLQCGGELSLRWEMHCSGTDDEGRRRTCWIAWASCPACRLFFVRRSPPRSAEERGWQLEPDPPAFARDGEWVEQLANEVKKNERPRPVHPIPAEAHGISFAALGLSGRVTRALYSEGLATAADLCVHPGDELLEIRNFGEAALKGVREKLAAFGLRLQGV